MKVFIKGKGEIELTDNDFIAEGGAGKVYGKQGLAFKIYLDPSNMIPLPKFNELSAIKNDRIIRPLDILLDPKTNKSIGFTMVLLDNSHTTPLAQLFTLGFRRKYGVQPEDMVKLVLDLHKTYEDVHAAKCLMIDGNEFSFKVDNQMTKVYVLDVDSFQTPSYPATFQMESIKDWHTQGFNVNTDWFAWAIVTFQMMIGIHPFRGFHKIYKDDFRERMQRNLSVFDKNVDLPPSVMPFTTIPPTLLAWYKAVFQDGKRMAPPSDYIGGAIVITADIRRINGTDKFEITLVNTYASDLVEYLSVGGVRFALTTAVTKKYPGAVHIGVGEGIEG
jgi:DNA-binding helix-hairpin-helix protein with protein kinase domain